MISRYLLIPIFIASLFVCTRTTGNDKYKIPFYTWQEIARGHGLSATDISVLKKNRFLITNDAYKQIFSAYLSGYLRFFITSDSLLNAYHVLYEESILRLENAMAIQLPCILEIILKNMEDVDDHLKGNPALVSAAKKRALLVTGIALKLIDDTFRFKDKEMNKILDQEVVRITKAEGTEMPKWLGKPDNSFAALDYSRYKPRGFYTRSERLKRYFRAVSWLQSIPFRIMKDEELLAILMLGSCVANSRFDDYSKIKEIESFFQAYRSFIGAGDDWDLMTAANESRDLRMNLKNNALQNKRTWLMKKAKGHGKGPLINDQIRFAPLDGKKTAEVNFRIISAYRTPSAILFHRTTDLRKFKRSFPNGLEVAVSLGSSFARKSLSGDERNKLLKTIDSCQTYFKGSSLYLKYLNALKALLDKPEPDAPDFMKNKAWQIKSCNTVLSGWAQLRHTWALQTKQTAHYLCAGRTPAGFVEPEPEFFSRMAELANATQKLLKQTGAFDSNYDRLMHSLEKFRGILDGVKNEDDIRKKITTLPRKEMINLELPFILMEMNTTKAERGSEAYFKEQRQWIKTFVVDIKEGRTYKYPELKKLLKEYNFDLEDLWNRFEKVSRQLEVISHKQLRRANLNKGEVAFIKRYGYTIAGIMFYGGNSYYTPRDDAPRVVDVYANPQNGGYLHIGIARPRKIYVLYPWKDKTVLCEGAVLPYYEFVSTSRLTDKSWKEILDSDKRPPLPKWSSSVVSGGKLSKPRLKDDD